MNRTVAVLLAIAVCAPGAAADPTCLEEAGRWGWGSPGPVSLDGDTLSFGSGSVLVLADVADPIAPAIVGSLTLRRAVDSLELRDGLAVVGTAGDGIWLVDVTDPSSPQLLARAWPHPATSPAWGASPAFDLEGDLLVVADPAALVVLDVADPTAPAELGRLELGLAGSGVVAEGRWAYVRADLRLTVVDLLDPENPVVAGTTPIDASPVALEGDLLALVPHFGGASFADVSDRAAPVLVGAHPAPFEYAARDVVLEGSTAYVMYEPASIDVLDVVDPANPVEVAGPAFLPDTGHVAVGDDLLAATALRSLALYDAGASAAGPLAELDVAADPRFVAAGREVAWVAQTQPAAGSSVSTVLAPGPPVQAAATVDLPVYAVATDGQLALVHTGDGVIAAVDVQDPGHPAVLAEVAPLGADSSISEVALALDGDAALLLLGSGFGLAELYVLDLTDPAAPVVVGPLAFWDSSSGPLSGHVAVHEGLGAAVVQDAVTLVDLRKPATPELAGELVLPFSYQLPPEIAVSDGLLTIASGDLYVADVSDPTTPLLVGRLEALSERHFARDVVFEGSNAFVLEDHNLGNVIRQVDLSDPARPVGRGFITAPAEALELAGDLLVTNEGGNGVGLYAVGACGTEPGLAADFTWTPETPRVGETIHLHDVSSGAITSWRWELPDGTTTTEPDPTFTFTDPAGGTVRLTVSDGASTATAARTIAVQLPATAPPLAQQPAEAHLLVATAAGRGPGEGGTFWRTRLELTNPGDEPVTAAVYLLESGVDGWTAPGAEVLVPPLRTLVFEEALHQLFGREAGTAALAVVAERPLAGAVTAFTWGLGGTFGQGIPLEPVGRLGDPGARLSAEAVTLILAGAREDEAFRTNVGLVNLGDAEASCSLSLYAADGSLLGREEQHVARLAHLQDGGLVARLAGAPLGTGSLRVECAAPAAVRAYLSVVDNRTGDPTFIRPVPLGSVALLPVAAHTPGVGGTFWRTDLDLANGGDAELEVAVSRAAEPGQPLRLTIAPHGAERLTDVIAALPPGAAAAPLLVTANAPVLSAASRTFTPSPGDGGTFGQGIPLVDPSRLGAPAGADVVLCGLWETVDGSYPAHRTNLGVSNATAAPIEILVELYDRRGRLLGGHVVQLEGHRHRQLNRALRPFVEGDVQGAWARLWTTTPGGRFVAYASVVDDGTGDPVLRLAQP